MPDAPDEMDGIRARIGEMIDAMIDRAAKDNYTDGRLKSVHLKVIKRVAQVMRPDTAVAYERLFGFGDNARAYLQRSDKRVAKLNPVKKRHLEKIRATLEELKICSDAPEIGDKLSSWLPYLDHALNAIIGQPAAIDPPGSFPDLGSVAAFNRKIDRASPDGAMPAEPFSRPAAPDMVAKRFPESNYRIHLPAYLMGREDAIDALERALKQCEGRLAIVALYGLRGVGKTTLAFAYADSRGGDCRAIWRIRAHTEPTMRADLVDLGVRLRWVAAHDTEEPALATVMERLCREGEGILLIYDNAIKADALKRYLPVTGSTQVLITSNAPTWRDVSATVVEIETWPKEIGAEFLIARAGCKDARNVAEDLSETLGGLPLAHEMAAAYCEYLGISLAEYHRRY